MYIIVVLLVIYIFLRIHWYIIIIGKYIFVKRRDLNHWIDQPLSFSIKGICQESENNKRFIDGWNVRQIVRMIDGLNK